MQRLIGLFLLLAIGGAGCDEATHRPSRVRLPSLTEPYVLPTAMCGDFFTVDVELNGQGPYTLLMDTGAGRTILDPTVFEETGIKSEIDSLRIGDFRAYEVAAGPLDMAQISAALGQDVRGVLGHPVFVGITIVYDYPNGQIIVDADSLDPNLDGVVAMRPTDRPYVGTRVGDDTFWTLIDTGSSGGLTFRKLNRFPQRQEPIATRGRIRVDGLHLVYTYGLSEDVKLGPITVNQPLVANSNSVDLVGQQILHRYRLTFDRRSNLMRWELPNDAGSLEDPLALDPVVLRGFVVEAQAEDPPVAAVFKGSPAEAAGIQEGDRLISRDGVAWRNRSCRSRLIDRPPPADSVSLVFRRDTDTLRVTLPIRTAQ